MLWGVMHLGGEYRIWHYVFCYQSGGTPRLFSSEVYEDAEEFAEHMGKKFPGHLYRVVRLAAPNGDLPNTQVHAVPLDLLTDEESWQNETRT